MATKYKEIATEIEKDLLNGKYHINKKLPTEEEFINAYNVSRSTIRKAIAILVNRGYVYQVQGSGMFIREAALKEYVNLECLTGLTREFPNKEITNRVINIKVVKANEELAEHIECEINDDLYFVERVRYIDNKPFVIEYSYFKKSIVPYLNADIVNHSIYNYIINDLRQGIGFADKIIYAEKLSKEDAELLELEVNDPGLVIENTAFLNNGEIFEYAKSIHNYKYAKLLKLANF